MAARRRKRAVGRLLPWLSGGSINFGDGLCLLHGLDALCPGHQFGRLTGLEGTARTNCERDCRHAFVIRHVGDDDEVIVAKAQPSADEFATYSFARRFPYSFDSVLRVL